MSIVAFSNLKPGVPTTLPHGTKIDGVAVEPDQIESDNDNVVVVKATPTSLTVRNDGGAPASANFLMRRWRGCKPQPFRWWSSNVNVCDGGGAIHTIYVRSSGDDVFGDGNFEVTAYRTIRRALQDVPQFIVNEQYRIDATGIGIEESDIPLLLRPHFSSDGFIINFDPEVPGGLLEGPLTIFAVPMVKQTIPASKRIDETPQPTTGLLTYNTTADLGAADSQLGRFIYGDPSPNFQTGVIAGNTGGPNSEIRVSHRFPIAAGSALKIAEASAVIKNTSGADDAFILRNQGCLIVIEGLEFEAMGSAARGIAVLSANSQSNFFLCRSDGVRFIDSGYLALLNSCYFDIKKSFFHGGAPQLSQSFLFRSTPDVRMAGLAGADAMRFTNCIIDSCEPVGSSGIDRHNAWNITLDRVDIRNGLSHGFFCPRGGVYELELCQIHDCAGDAVRTQGGKGFTNNVDSSVGGPNAGLGQCLLDGAQVRSRSTTSVTGTAGDYKVGANAVGNYPIPSGSEDDLVALTSELCRIYT